MEPHEASVFALQGTRPGYVVALPAELKTLGVGRVAWERTLGVGRAGHAWLGGVGAAAATAGARALLEAGCRSLVSWGSAGGLDPALAPGQLLLPQTVRGADGGALAVDQELRERVIGALGGHPPIASGDLTEAAKVLGEAAGKGALRARTGAVAVDMESVAVGRVGAAVGVPFLVVRAVADPAGFTVPGLVGGSLDARGRLSLPRFLLRAAVRPDLWPAIGRLSQSFEAATRTLRRVAPIIAGQRD